MSLFFRMHTDRRRTPVELVDQFAGSRPAACWLIGGGASLDELPLDRIVTSPTPKMGLNLAGAGRLRPDFWTAYDPSNRFLSSVYFDPGILKFVPARRAMDLVPDSVDKVCDSPNLVLFDGDPQRGFADFLSPAHPRIVDWNDTFVQAIDILYRLGFRTIYLAGCEMHVAPGPAWIAAAQRRGLEFVPGQLLGDFVNQCERAGMTRAEMETLGTGRQYHFDETKLLAAAINTDQHYFRIAQYLRLSRRSIALAGLRLVSVTPFSRLNDYFPYLPVETVLDEIRDAVGDPAAESTRGLYTGASARRRADLGPMRDLRPRHWRDGRPPEESQDVATPPGVLSRTVRDYFEEIPEAELREEG